MTLKPTDIVEILEQLSHSQCQDFQLTLGGDSLRLCRSVAGRPAQHTSAPGEIAAQPLPAPTAAPQTAHRPAGVAPQAVRPIGKDVIAAPMGGIFYRCPSPDEPPFVEEGAQVKAGDPVCVIEVMKLFSTVHAEFDGCITAIHVNDGDSVGQDQILFSIERAGGRS